MLPSSTLLWQQTGGGGAYSRCQTLKCPHQFRANLGSANLLTEGGSSRTCRESTLAKGEQGVLHTEGPQQASGQLWPK